jgi:hypothetical protein
MEVEQARGEVAVPYINRAGSADSAARSRSFRGPNVCSVMRAAIGLARS